MHALRRPLPYREYNVALILIAVNFFVFFVTNVRPQMLTYLAMNPVLVLRGGYFWTPFTYMFVHANMNHVLFNMLGLFFFGTQVERRIGSLEFLAFYLVTGLLAGLFSLAVYWYTGGYMVFLLGASGAIFATLLAFATFFPGAYIYLFFVLPVKAPYLVIGYTVLELFNSVAGRGGNVAHFTHLAGFVFAFLYLFARLQINPIQVFLNSRRY
ncbi:MAG: rhomboid family intramembrane serine protease [Spirochaetaceae bacterium]|nr:MAG: rhomboid family intramembrane serine protease [Spirochaetaceae bacterium]